MPLKLFGIDCGASSGRGILGEYDGARLSLMEIHRFDNSPVTLGGHLRWDFPRLYHELLTGLRKAASTSAATAASAAAASTASAASATTAVSASGRGDIASIGVNTWGVDFGFIDEYGELMYNPLHYRDALTSSEMERLRALVSDEELYRRTGIQFMFFNTIYQLSALKRLYPSVCERAAKMLLLPDLFGYFLTGEMTAEYSIASTTAMLDARRRDWDAALLRAVGLNPELLPAISMPGAALGALRPQVAEEVGIKGAKVISVCGHDTAGAVLAAPIRKNKPGAYLSCGTWSLLGVELDEPLTNEAAFAAQYTNEGGYGGTIRFLKNIMGQWMANEIKKDYERDFGPIEFAAIDALEQDAPRFVSFVDVGAPEFARPGHMTEKVNDFCYRTGQKTPDGLGALMRCVNESIALSYRANIDALEGILGHELPELRVVGGGIKNKSLMAMTAGALNRPVCAGPVEASAAGNILAQMLALGEISDRWDARELVANSFDEIVYEPSASDAGAWGEAYSRYMESVKGK